MLSRKKEYWTIITISCMLTVDLGEARSRNTRVDDVTNLATSSAPSCVADPPIDHTHTHQNVGV